MNRLSSRLMLAFVSMTLLTVGLLTVPQLQGLAAERVVLPEEERPVLTAALWDRAMALRYNGTLRGPFEAILDHDPSSHGMAISGTSAAILRDRIAGTQATAYVIAPNIVIKEFREGAQGQATPTNSSSATLTPGTILVPGGGSGTTPHDEASAADAASITAPGGATAPTTSEATIPRRDIVTFLRDSLERRAVVLVGSASLALVLAAGMALVLARVIARPVESVTRAATRVAEGDLTVRIPLPRGGVDASETARLAQSFNAMADSLERLERNRKNMVADVAHELRTPLTVMRGRLEALEDGVTPLELSEVHDLHAQVLVLSRLVEDLRVLSLADAGKLSLELQDVELSELAHSVVSGFQVTARERGIALSVEAAPGVVTTGDRDRLTQVMVNLVDNAMRITPAGGSVSVVVTATPDGPLFEVRDSGPGIPAGSERRIFERFVRTDDGRARADGGSGLGLAIVNSIVELHNGTVRAWNSAAGGAVFSVQLER